MGNLGQFDIEANADTNYEKREYTPLPKGMYSAIITKSEVKQSMKGGEYLKVEFTITEDPYANRKVFQNYTLVNENEKAQKIGLGQLSALCKACGKTGIVGDSSELHDIEIMIKVDVGEYNGKPTNEVKGAEKKSFTVAGSYNIATKQMTLNTEVKSTNFSNDDIPF